MRIIPINSIYYICMSARLLCPCTGLLQSVGLCQSLNAFERFSHSKSGCPPLVACTFRGQAHLGALEAFYSSHWCAGHRGTLQLRLLPDSSLALTWLSKHASLLQPNRHQDAAGATQGHYCITTSTQLAAIPPGRLQDPIGDVCWLSAARQLNGSHFESTKLSKKRGMSTSMMQMHGKGCTHSHLLALFTVLEITPSTS